MTPASKKAIVYGFIGLGFAGLIGAHEFATPALGADSGMTIPFILAAIGTICFIAAGLMARKLMKDDASK